MKNRHWLLFALGCLFACGPASAQSTFGSIVGTVQDSSGAVIAASEVGLTNVDENTNRKTVSNDAGLYQFLNLKPGRYSLSAQKPGFATARIVNIALDARQEKRVDVTLGVAGVQQTVEVTAEVTAINTENATISSTMNNAQVTQLPSNYRGATTSPLGAIVAAPGVQQDDSGAISLAGGLPSMTDFTVDGVSTTNVRFNGPGGGNVYPSSEMLGEFRVSAINNNAEFASAGDVTVTSKSGANAVHGSLFEYLQNSFLDAKNYGFTSKQAKAWNTFGGSFSGPVVIPRLYNGHDKTFFFVDYEGNRHPGSLPVTASVPTQAMRQGNLNGVPGPAAIDPSTGLPFPGNQIPVGELSSVSQTLLNVYYPLPTTTGGSVLNNYQALVPLHNTTNGYDIRIDQYIGSRNQLFGRWSWKNHPFQALTGSGLLPPTTIAEFDRSLLLSDSFTITPNVVNEFRFGLARVRINSDFPILGTDAVAKLGLTGLNLTNAHGYGGFPGFNFSDGTGFTSVGLGKQGQIFSQTTEYTDNIAWIKGKHTTKFGFDLRRLNYRTPNNFAASDDFGSFVFLSGFQAGTFVPFFSGNAFADLLLGEPFLSLVFATGPVIDETSNHFAFYGQDEYRVSKSLTLTLGLRWELLPPFKEKYGDITNFNPVNGDVVIPDNSLPAAAAFLYTINACPGVVATLPCTNVRTASKEGWPQGLRHTYWKNFDPRVGIAWRPFGNDKTVFRGGFGIYTVTSLGSVAYQLAGIAATDARVFVAFQGPGNPPAFQFPQALLGGGGLDPSQVGTQDFIEGMDPHFRDPATAQWNVTMERELGKNWSIRSSYIGSNSYRLTEEVDLNQLPATTTPYDPTLRPFKDWGRLLTVSNLAFANYQAWETQVNHRVGAGLSLQGTYTWAKNLSNANGDAPLRYVGEAGFTTGAGAPGPVGIADRFNLRSMRGNDPGTRRHRALISMLYQLPFGRGQRFMRSANAFVNGVLGDWQVSTITLVESGPFMTATISPGLSQSNLNEAIRGIPVRPDQIGNCNLPHPIPNPNGNGLVWFNYDAFVPTPSGAARVGNEGVGSCVGPRTVAVAGGLSKNFRLSEKAKLRFEATFTNLLNHPNFAPPTIDVTTRENFGVTSTVQTQENGGNRVGQLSLRIDF
jgi:Carboxypeptidase regulatory-like domain/TonB dependent receptor